MPAGFIRKDGYGITAGRAQLPRAADPRRGAAAVRPRWHPEVRDAEECGGEAEAAADCQRLIARPTRDFIRCRARLPPSSARRTSARRELAGLGLLLRFLQVDARLALGVERRRRNARPACATPSPRRTAWRRPALATRIRSLSFQPAFSDGLALAASTKRARGWQVGLMRTTANAYGSAAWPVNMPSRRAQASGIWRSVCTALTRLRLGRLAADLGLGVGRPARTGDAASRRAAGRATGAWQGSPPVVTGPKAGTAALNDGFTPATGFTATAMRAPCCREVRFAQCLCDSRAVAAVAPRPVQHYNSRRSTRNS